jgi:hypothetical protein
VVKTVNRVVNVGLVHRFSRSAPGVAVIWATPYLASFPLADDNARDLVYRKSWLNVTGQFEK